MSITDKDKAAVLREAADWLSSAMNWTVPSIKLLQRANELDPPMPAEPDGDVVVRDRDGTWWKPDGTDWLIANRASTAYWNWPALWDSYGPLTIYEAKR